MRHPENRITKRIVLFVEGQNIGGSWIENGQKDVSQEFLMILYWIELNGGSPGGH